MKIISQRGYEHIKTVLILLALFIQPALSDTVLCELTTLDQVKEKLYTLRYVQKDTGIHAWSLSRPDGGYYCKPSHVSLIPGGYVYICFENDCRYYEVVSHNCPSEGSNCPLTPPSFNSQLKDGASIVRQSAL